MAQNVVTLKNNKIKHTNIKNKNNLVSISYAIIIVVINILSPLSFLYVACKDFTKKTWINTKKMPLQD